MLTSICGLNKALRKVKQTTKPVPLELDHINGDNKDNRLIDLRLFCLTAMH